MTDFLNTPSGASRSKYEFLLIIFLAVIAFLIYAKTLTGDFIFDDHPNIRDNPYVRLTKITPLGLFKAAFFSPAPNRPVPNISFALNYYFQRYNPVGYHLVNIIIHTINAVLLYLFVKTTFRTPLLRPQSRLCGQIAFFTALIWMVHPLQTQSVSYIVQRMNSMAAMFYLLSMLLYAEARFAAGKQKKTVLFSACVLSAILAFGSKENSVTLPFFIFLYEWYFFENLSGDWIKRMLPIILVVSVIIGVIAAFYFGGSPLERMLSGYTFRDFTMGQRVMTQFRVVIFYVSLIFWPHPARLNLDHDFPTSLSLLDPVATLAALVAICGFIGVSVVIAKKERLLSFCILWFLGNLVIESSVVGLEMVFEHRNYLPSMMVVLMTVVLIYRFLKPQWLKPAALIVVAAVFAAWTYERNQVWLHPVTIWKDCTEKSPEKARPFNNLGAALGEYGQHRKAIEYYRKALQINPGYAEAHGNLGYDLALLGYLDEAVAHLRKALEINPKFYEAYNNLGIVLTLQGHYEEAVEQIKAAIAIKPDFPNAHNSLGTALKRLGRLEEAKNQYFEALKIDPQFAAAHNNLGLVLEQEGRLDEARAHFAEAVRIDPGFEKAQKNLEDSLKETVE
jgi:tetratricopeptide (TPR) repeat protein